MPSFDLIGFGENGRGELLLYATAMTLTVTLVSMIIGSVLGALVAWSKTSESVVLRLIGETYTTRFRGAPELLVIYLIYFGGSQAVSVVGHWFGAGGFIGLPPFMAGALAVGVISGSYQAEVYRGAYRAISPGEIDAARSVGMSWTLRVRRIIVPQVVRFALPGLGNVWQLSLKDSALVSVTGLAELMRTSQSAAGSTHQYFLFYVAGGALYLLLTTVSENVFGAAERHVARSFHGGLGRT